MCACVGMDKNKISQLFSDGISTLLSTDEAFVHIEAGSKCPHLSDILYFLDKNHCILIPISH